MYVSTTLSLAQTFSCDTSPLVVVPLPPHRFVCGRKLPSQNVIAELARQSDEDDSALLLGLRQDVLDHVQYLDSFSYNNVFVGEERQILGTKIDFDTPRMGENHLCPKVEGFCLRNARHQFALGAHHALLCVFVFDSFGVNPLYDYTTYFCFQL